MAHSLKISIPAFLIFASTSTLAQVADSEGIAPQPGSSASINQTGSANQAYIEQQSILAPEATSGNSAGILQDGAGNIGAISQFGQSNNAALEQHGSNLNNAITQTGVGLSVNVQEFGNGTGTPVTINQYSVSPTQH